MAFHLETIISWESRLSMLECPSSCEPQVYIVSQNNHFFILKDEPEAYYIIDTSGERLYDYEGCNSAYKKSELYSAYHKMLRVMWQEQW
jgi:hypothetical protein